MELRLDQLSKSYDGGKSYALRDFSMNFWFFRIITYIARKTMVEMLYYF